MLLADLQLRNVPGSRPVSAVERQLHCHFGLLRRPGLQHPSGKHERNLPARQLSWYWPGVLGDRCLLLRPALSQPERHDLHGRRSHLHLHGWAALAGQNTTRRMISRERLE